MTRAVKKAISSKRGSRAAGSGRKAKRASTAAGTKKRVARKVPKKGTKKATKKATKKKAKKTPTKARKDKSAKKVTRGGASAKRAGATRDSGRVGRTTRSINRTATAGAKQTKKAARNVTAKKAKAVSVKSGKKRLGSKASRAVAPSPTSQDPIQFFEETRRLPKTALTAKQLDEFRQLLLKKRRELIGDVRHLQRDASRSGGESSPMPIHMADLGSDNWEHEFTLGSIENEQGRIRMIDGALARIADKTYGVCLATYKRIGVVRLRAKPWAKYCIEYARAWEEGRVP